MYALCKHSPSRWVPGPGVFVSKSERVGILPSRRHAGTALHEGRCQGYGLDDGAGGIGCAADVGAMTDSGHIFRMDEGGAPSVESIGGANCGLQTLTIRLLGAHRCLVVIELTVC